MVQSKAARPAQRQPAPPNRSQTTAPPRKRGIGSSSPSLTASTPGDERDTIQVVVRCRGPSPRELEENASFPVQVCPTRGTQVTIAADTQQSAPQPFPLASSSLFPPDVKTSSSSRPSSASEKAYQFDHVFGPEADQGMLYNDVVAPILDEVLLGYNCTVFAYGQTGTGKTYTMSGDLTSAAGTFTQEAGIIPRTLHRLFHILETEHADFAVRVSFIELYNEELRDLNTPSSFTDLNDPQAFPLATDAAGGGLRIFDDASATSSHGAPIKNKNVVIHGLEETAITSAADGVRVLTRGSQRRQIAATNFNENSSRSHSIFSITVHIKEQGSKGEDLLKVGKFNLVDLAGSENVGRSGAEKGRAREAGMINQSLLTLGRVINGLVDKSPHIPYRESKLTRLLQDSLGGRTKTCVIATVSPSRSNLEESISTLEYATRARSIRNRPELNQRMTKAALLSLYSQEVERLKSDLLAAREKNGVYLSAESWDELSTDLQTRGRALEETKRRAEVCESQLKTTKEQFEQNLRLLGSRETELKSLSEETDKRIRELKTVYGDLRNTRIELDGERRKRRKASVQQREWKDVADKAVHDTEGLRGKIERKSKVEDNNSIVILKVLQSLGDAKEYHKKHFEELNTQQKMFTNELQNSLREFFQRQSNDMKQASENLKERSAKLSNIKKESSQCIELTQSQSQIFTQEVENFRTRILSNSENLANTIKDECNSALKDMEQKTSQIFNHTISTLSAAESCIENSHKAIIDLMDENQEIYTTYRDAQIQELAAENERLTKHNTRLTELLATQDKQMVDAQEDLSSKLLAWFEERRKYQLEHLQASVSEIQSDLKDAHSARNASVTDYGKRVDVLHNNHHRIHKIFEEEHKMISEISTNAKQDTTKNFEAVKERMEDHNRILDVAVDDNTDKVSNVTNSIKTSTGTFKEEFGQAVEMSSACFSDLLNSGSDANENEKNTLSAWIEEGEQVTGTLSHNISAYRQDALECMEKNKEMLDNMSDSISRSLSNGIQKDVPSGSTPTKRQWPEFHADQQEKNKEAEGETDDDEGGEHNEENDNCNSEEIGRKETEAIEALDSVLNAIHSGQPHAHVHVHGHGHGMSTNRASGRKSSVSHHHIMRPSGVTTTGSTTTTTTSSLSATATTGSNNQHGGLLPVAKRRRIISNNNNTNNISHNNKPNVLAEKNVNAPAQITRDVEGGEKEKLKLKESDKGDRNRRTTTAIRAGIPQPVVRSK